MSDEIMMSDNQIDKQRNIRLNNVLKNGGRCYLFWLLLRTFVIIGSNSSGNSAMYDDGLSLFRYSAQFYVVKNDVKSINYLIVKFVDLHYFTLPLVR